MNYFELILQSYIIDEEYKHYKNILNQIEKNFSLSYFLSKFSQVYVFTQNLQQKEIIQKDINKLYKNYPNVEFAYWSLEDVIRISMILRIKSLPQEKYIEYIKKCYSIADTKERCSLLKSFAIIDSNGDFLSLSLDAIRTNIPNILAAIACGNFYPDMHFSEAEFNNMVLKAIFMNISIANIYALTENVNLELMKMVSQYVDEREVAGRDFPPEVWLVITPFLAEKEIEKVYKHVTHSSPQHRYWAIKSLINDNKNSHSKILKKQLQMETNKEIKQLLLRYSNEIF